MTFQSFILKISPADLQTQCNKTALRFLLHCTWLISERATAPRHQRNMGNKASSLPTPDPAVLNDDYEWPENMYLELRDMANISFLVYTFAYLTDVAREFGLKGMDINDEGRIGMPTRDLPRSFSPAEVIEIIENNLDTLKSRYQTFFDGSSYEFLIQKLKLLQGKRILASSLW